MKINDTLFRRARAGTAAKAVFLLALFVFAGFSARATNWYVDNSVVGSSNKGTSWANAWTSISAIGWGSINPGDTIYISGGSSSQVYYETLTIGASGTAASPINISVGHDAGHTGQVILDGQSSNGNGINLANYVNITGNNGAGSTNLVIRNWIDTTTNWNGIGIYGDENVGVTIKYVEIYAVNNAVTALFPDLMEIAYCYVHNIQGDHGIAIDGSGLGSGQSGFDRDSIHNCIIQVNSGMVGSSCGADAISGSSGGTVYSNVIYAALGTVTGCQHQDGVQILGEYWKVYANSITDMGNSCSEVSQYNANTGHYYFYNNVCRIATPSVNGYERGIEWDCSWNGSGGYNQLTSITDVHILNNIFVDIYGYYATGYIWDGYNPTVSNFEIKNNIYYNSGSAYQPGVAIWMDPSTGYSQSDVTISNNIIYAGGSGTTQVIIDGSAYAQVNPPTGVPQFVSYSQRNYGNDFHLSPSDTAAKDKGLTLSNYFTTDKDGITRPQGPAWDIGPYEYHTTVVSTNPVIAVSPSSQNFGSIVTGTNVSLTFTVQNAGGGTLTGSATVASPYSILSGGTYNLGSNQSQVVTVQYSPTVAGTNNQNVTFTGGGGTTVSVMGSAYAPLSGLVFAATSGTITAPFVITNGSVYQAVQTGVTNGGSATYTFNITNAGNYVVQATVNAPSDSENSLYVNIDAQPTDPYMTWQIPITTGFQNLVVSWQGNGTYDNSQFVPEIFALTQGTHQLIIRGREMNTYLQQVSILKIPSPPTGLHIVPGS
jgi:hypothetical protein